MHLLLVEDDPGLGEALSDHLGSLGHVVDWRQRLIEADEAIRAKSFDALLLDLHLPDGSGLDFLRKLRSSRYRTTVIVLAASESISLQMAAYDAGADDYLAKPFDLTELSKRLTPNRGASQDED